MQWDWLVLCWSSTYRHLLTIIYFAVELLKICCCSIYTVFRFQSLWIYVLLSCCKVNWFSVARTICQGTAFHVSSRRWHSLQVSLETKARTSKGGSWTSENEIRFSSIRQSVAIKCKCKVLSWSCSASISDFCFRFNFKFRFVYFSSMTSKCNIQKILKLVEQVSQCLWSICISNNWSVSSWTVTYLMNCCWTLQIHFTCIDDMICLMSEWVGFIRNLMWLLISICLCDSAQKLLVVYTSFGSWNSSENLTLNILPSLPVWKIMFVEPLMA